MSATPSQQPANLSAMFNLPGPPAKPNAADEIGKPSNEQVAVLVKKLEELNANQLKIASENEILN